MAQFTRWNRWMLTIAAALLLMGLSAGSAAAGSSSPTTPKEPPRAEKTYLEREFKAQRQYLEYMEKWIKGMRERAGNLEKVIAYLKGKKYQTADLEKALAAYRTGINAALREFNQARAVYKAHVGFDNKGKVTNLDQARATLQKVRDHMKQAGTIIGGADGSLRAAVVDYFKKHGLKPPKGLI